MTSLIQDGVDCSSKGKYGTPAMTAAVLHYAPTDVLHLFLNHCADCNAKAQVSQNDTPLQMYLGININVDKALVERLLRNTCPSDEVYISICQHIGYCIS